MGELPLPPQRDMDILKRLAERRLAIVNDPVNRERKDAWYRLDSGKGDRVMVLIEAGGVRDPKGPGPKIPLECTDDWARGMENSFRWDEWTFEVLKDDHVVEPWLNVGWNVNAGGYGVQAVSHHADDPGILGARRWDPALADMDKDFHKLKKREFSVDRDGTLAYKAKLEKVFGGLLPVRIRGGYWWTMGMTMPAIDLIGLENLMLAMYDNPEGLHRVMNFLCEDHLAFADWLEREGLLNLNNENDYIGSGSMGYTRDLPQAGWRPGNPVKTRDQWVLLESQETVGVGPDQFREFIFPYQLRIAQKFGKVYYGCCEPVHTRMHVLEEFPNLARISISPWADEKFMAARMGRKYVFSRKPSPTLISTAIFNEDAIRDDIRRTLSAAKGCRAEIIMKDVHTLHNEPERLARWVQLTREVIAKHA